MGNELDIYFASSSLNFIILAVSTSSINSALTPIFVKYYKVKNYSKLYSIASTLFNLLFLTFLLLVFLQFIFSNQIIGFIVPGFSTLDSITTVELFKIHAIISIFGVLSALISSIYYTQKKFYRTIIVPIISYLIQIIFVYYFQSIGVYSLVYGLFLSQLFIFIIFAIPFIKKYKFSITIDREVISAIKKVVPLIFSSAFSKSNIIVDRFFASSLNPGSISVLQYGEKIIKLISGLILKGLSLVTLRKFSLIENNSTQFLKLFYLLNKSIIFIILPVTFSIFFFSDDALNFIDLSENIAFEDISKLYLVIICLLGFLVGGSLSTVITNAFYAKGLTMLISKFNVILQIIGIILKIFLFYKIGFWGLPLALSINSLVGSLILYFFYFIKISNFNYGIIIRYSLKVFAITLFSTYFTDFISNILFDFWLWKVLFNLFLFAIFFGFLSIKFENEISKFLLFKLIKKEN